MIVTGMESLKGLIRQVRNILRVSSGLISVSSIREKRVKNVTIQHRFRLGKSTAHLVIHYTAVTQISLFIQGVVPSLLRKGMWILYTIRVKNGIAIDIHQVLEILVIGRGHRINRLIRISHGIQKGIERTLDELHKGIL